MRRAIRYIGVAARTVVTSEGLQVVDHVGERVESLLDREAGTGGAPVPMLVGDETGGGQVGRSLQADAEGVQAGATHASVRSSSSTR